MMRYLFFILIPSIFFTTQLSAQTKRIELDATGDYKNFKFCPLGEHGAILFKQHRKKNGGNNVFEFVHFNNDLEVGEKVDIEVDNKFEDFELVSSENYLHCLFHNSQKKELYYFRLDPKTMKVDRVDIELPKKLNVEKRTVKVNDNRFITNFTFRTRRNYEIVLINPNDKTASFISPKSLYSIKNGYIVPFVIQGIEELPLVINAEEKKDNYTTSFSVADNQGKPKFTPLQLNADEENVQVLMKAYGKSDNSNLLAGIYTNRGEKKAQGIAFSKVNNDKLSFLKTYSFSKFDVQVPVEVPEMIVPKQISLKISSGFDRPDHFSSFFHDIVQLDGSHIIVSQYYYKTRVERTDKDGFMRMELHSTTLSHATVVAFDDQGNKLWDNTLNINTLHTSAVELVDLLASVSVVNNGLSLSYMDNGTLYVKKLNNEGKVTVDKKYDLIPEGYERKWVIGENGMHWYGNNYIAFGEEKLSNKSEGGDDKKTVYSIKKITVTE